MYEKYKFLSSYDRGPPGWYPAEAGLVSALAGELVWSRFSLATLLGAKRGQA